MKPKFFARPTLTVARELLGKFLVRRVGEKIMAGMITEVEAYVGLEDKASHASRGKTARTEVMFGKPGYWYVYLVYGMHFCLNVVTEKAGYPAAILIRAVDQTFGPGRVCKKFKIDRQLNKKSVTTKISSLWIEERGVKINPNDIKQSKRVGVDYAGKWKNKLWRFYVSGACPPLAGNGE